MKARQRLPPSGQPTLGADSSGLLICGMGPSVVPAPQPCFKNSESVQGAQAFVCSQEGLVVIVLVTQSCQTLCQPMNCSPPGFSGRLLWDPWDSPRKNTGMSCHSPLLSEPPWPFPRQPRAGAWRKWGRQVWELLLSSTLAPGEICGAFTSTCVPTWISAFAPVWLGPRVGETPALAPESELSDSQGRA